MLMHEEINGYVYFGRDTCPICLYLNKFLEKEYKKNVNLLIYKFDTDFWKGHKNYQDVLKKYGISKVPTLIKISEDKSYKIFDSGGVNDEEIQKDLHNFLYE